MTEDTNANLAQAYGREVARSSIAERLRDNYKALVEHLLQYAGCPGTQGNCIHLWDNCHLPDRIADGNLTEDENYRVIGCWRVVLREEMRDEYDEEGSG